MLSGQERCENHLSLIQVTVSGNTHLGPGQFWTLSTFRPRCRGKNSLLIHTMYNRNISSALCTWCRERRGGWRTGSNNQPCNFRSAPHLLCSEQDAPIVLNHVKKKQPTEAFVLRNLSSKERAEAEQFNSLRTFVS